MRSTLLNMLAHVPERFVGALMTFLIKVRALRKIEAWKEAIILLFLKPGTLPTFVGSYRPIALTSCLAKFLGNVFNIRSFSASFKKACLAADHLVRLENSI